MIGRNGTSGLVVIARHSLRAAERRQDRSVGHETGKRVYTIKVRVSEAERMAVADFCQRRRLDVSRWLRSLALVALGHEPPAFRRRA